jgi:hypothetical protein
MLSYHDWLEAILAKRYVSYNCPEYIPALELSQPALISQTTHNWLYPFYLDNVSASEFHSELYRLSIDTNGMWSLD